MGCYQDGTSIRLGRSEHQAKTRIGSNNKDIGCLGIKTRLGAGADRDGKEQSCVYQEGNKTSFDSMCRDRTKVPGFRDGPGTAWAGTEPRFPASAATRSFYQDEIRTTFHQLIYHQGCDYH